MIPLRDQFYAWRNVVFALFLRELQSKFNDKFGLSWAFVEPFVFIFTLSFARGAISGDDVHGLPVVIFMIVGMVGYQLFITTLQSVSISIKRNKPLYAFRQVQPLAAVVGSGFIELSIKCIVVGMLCASLYLLGMPASVDETLMLITLFFTLWLFGVSTGLIFGVAAAFVPEVDKIKSLVTRPLMFISCVFLVYKTFQRSTGTT
ncbi:ABC transporter permease [Alteromonas sp. KUL49]|uniref:ABC transporter permease n=1 Tax=Alteromonas sp. KUL49 TaxID=2480798 RepID=UPI001F5E6B9A|nr:ABC transporter permease [Alteromonas sp. KUL49]